MNIIDINNLDIVFGQKPKKALMLLDQGQDREIIRKNTGNIIGVRNISLAIKACEIFSIMGLSGSGKSTLLRAINGLVPITRGQININIDQESFKLLDINPVELRRLRSRHVAMVFQKFALLPWKTVAQNIAFGLELAHVDKDFLAKQVKKSIALVGLSSWEDRYPHELSGGMQQRVGLARALATDAKILLMDEPFSALDPLIKKSLQDELLHLQKTLKKTILFVTHDVDEAFKLGNQIAIMKDGSIIQSGQADEILASPKSTYVKDFLSHVDQTKFIKAKNLMIPLAKLNSSDKLVSLDQEGIYNCLLDENFCPKNSLCKGVKGNIIPWAFSQNLDQSDLALGHEELALKEIINALCKTKKPMIIKDHTDKMVGAITMESILSILGQGF
jgi:glycine betaine/proline transport system ATP-binding protein